MAVFKCCNPRIQVPTNMYFKAKKTCKCVSTKIYDFTLYPEITMLFDDISKYW